MSYPIRGVVIRGVMIAPDNFITPRIKKMVLLRRIREVCQIRGS